tara:strand:- start:461 stop:811 length:351 start_codon:yes stop_codon:yes gene_type:complete
MSEKKVTKFDRLCLKAELMQANLLAQQAFFEEHGEPMYCGFAWVDVPVTRTNSKEAKMLAEWGFTKSWLPKTMQFWIGQKVGNYGQSMDIKIAGAKAMVEKLAEHGIKATYGCRAD